jgi:signal transduction histidine kinase
MLQHSRGGSGKTELTDLNKLVREYVNFSFHGMRAGQRTINVSIDLQLDDRVGMIPLIREDFSRVILNLCNNAFDAMRDKQVNGSDEKYNAKLSVRTSNLDGKVQIEIEDNGSGISERNRDRILQPFFTTKKGTEGTGLGLSISNDIIKAHNGVLELKSELDVFTLFRILLPQPI